jgi:hypothetical protein
LVEHDSYTAQRPRGIEGTGFSAAGAAAEAQRVVAIFSPEAYTKTIASPSTMDSSYAMQATTELPFVTPADCFVLPADCFPFLRHIAFRAAGA